MEGPALHVDAARLSRAAMEITAGHVRESAEVVVRGAPADAAVARALARALRETRAESVVLANAKRALVSKLPPSVKRLKMRNVRFRDPRLFRGAEVVDVMTPGVFRDDDLCALSLPNVRRLRLGAHAETPWPEDLAAWPSLERLDVKLRDGAALRRLVGAARGARGLRHLDVGGETRAIDLSPLLRAVGEIEHLRRLDLRGETFRVSDPTPVASLDRVRVLAREVDPRLFACLGGVHVTVLSSLFPMRNAHDRDFSPLAQLDEARPASIEIVVGCDARTRADVVDLFPVALLLRSETTLSSCADDPESHWSAVVEAAERERAYVERASCAIGARRLFVDLAASRSAAVARLLDRDGDADVRPLAFGPLLREIALFVG